LLLAERRFPVERLTLLASPRSAGQAVEWNGQNLTIEPVTAEAFNGVDVVLASAGGSVSKQWAPVAAAAGAVVIDNSSAFRMDGDVPLVVPEVNPHAAFQHKGVIANPNCTTILMTLALAPPRAFQDRPSQARRRPKPKQGPQGPCSVFGGRSQPSWPQVGATRA